LELDIIYQDEEMVAINKPNGLLVHPSPIARNADTCALHELRDQIDQYVYPIHRLDRKTSGVLLFALSAPMAKSLGEIFSSQQTYKTYHAIVRGWFPKEITSLEYDLTNDRGKTQSAITDFRLIKHSEIDLAFGKHLSSRYSLVEINPQTGRQHQIRKHLAHLRYPIIGDRPHGCNKQNRLFKEKWNMTYMLLHASELQFIHPLTKKSIQIKKRSSIWDSVFLLIFSKLKRAK